MDLDNLNNSIDFQSINIISDNIIENLDTLEETKIEYKYRLKNFLNFLRLNGLKSNSLLEYKKLLTSKESFTTSTRNKYLAVAKVFLKELYFAGKIQEDLTLKVRFFKISKKHKKFGIT